MRILHAVVSIDPAQGGPPAVALRLAAAQAALGHEVTLTCHDSPGRQDAIRASLNGIPGIEAVRLKPLPDRLTLRTMVPSATRHALGCLVEEVDVVHVHSVWEPLVHQAAVQAFKAGKPYVVTPHGVLDPWCLQQKWLKKRVALALTYRRMLQRAACLHALNSDEAALLAPLRLRSPVRVIPNGVFLEEIDPLPPRGRFHAAHPELGGRPYVLFLSRLHHKKGLDFLADAFAKVSRAVAEARLVVAGPDGGAQADFERQVAGLAIQDRVHVVGPLWGPRKLEAMVDASCFCLPSRQEGFSLAITEALACGTPAVVSKPCHFPEVAQEGAGEVVELEASAIAAALIRLMGDPERCRAMGHAGRRLVLSRFTWPRVAGQTLEMYAAASRKSA